MTLLQHVWERACTTLFPAASQAIGRTPRNWRGLVCVLNISHLSAFTTGTAPRHGSCSRTPHLVTKTHALAVWIFLISVQVHHTCMECSPVLLRSFAGLPFSHAECSFACQLASNASIASVASIVLLRISFACLLASIASIAFNIHLQHELRHQAVPKGCVLTCQAHRLSRQDVSKFP